MMNRKDRKYHAFLLRLWQVMDSSQLVWRASLEDAQTHDRIGFVSVDDLCAYLRKHAGMSSVSGEDGGNADQKEDE